MPRTVHTAICSSIPATSNERCGMLQKDGRRGGSDVIPVRWQLNHIRLGGASAPGMAPSFEKPVAFSNTKLFRHGSDWTVCMGMFLRPRTPRASNVGIATLMALVTTSRHDELTVSQRAHASPRLFEPWVFEKRISSVAMQRRWSNKLSMAPWNSDPPSSSVIGQVEPISMTRVRINRNSVGCVSSIANFFSKLSEVRFIALKRCDWDRWVKWREDAARLLSDELDISANQSVMSSSISGGSAEMGIEANA